MRVTYTALLPETDLHPLMLNIDDPLDCCLWQHPYVSVLVVNSEIIGFRAKILGLGILVQFLAFLGSSKLEI